MNKLFYKATTLLRMNGKALADATGLALSQLKIKKMNPWVAKALGDLIDKKGQPLTTVADMVEIEAERLEDNLVDDVDTYTKRRLAAEKSLAAMPEKHEMALTELNAFRLHMKGEQPVARYAHLNTWALAYPVERALQKAVFASDAAAQEDKRFQITLLDAAIDALASRLDAYEEAHGPLHDAANMLSAFGPALETLQAKLQQAQAKRQAIIAEAPLVVANDVQDESLPMLFPTEAEAQKAAEQALAPAIDAIKGQQRKERKEEQQHTAQVLQQQFNTYMAQKKNGQAAVLAPVPTQALRRGKAIPAQPVMAATTASTATQPLAPATAVHAASHPEAATQQTATLHAQAPSADPSTDQIADQSTDPSAEASPEGTTETSAATPTEVHTLATAAQPVQAAAGQSAPTQALTVATPNSKIDPSLLPEHLTQATSLYQLTDLPPDINPDTISPLYRPKGWTQADEDAFIRYKQEVLNGKVPEGRILAELLHTLMIDRREEAEEIKREQAKERALAKQQSGNKKRRRGL